ncbi:polyphosphate polymerase domain-containing protein [Nocardiopsis coralliicola]
MSTAASGGQQRTALLPAIGLDEVVALAELQTRVDRKYLVPHRAAQWLERRLAAGGDWAELEIGGRRGFRYSSTYFDTPDLLTYRQHAQGRRRRFKIRTRGYLDSGTATFEVKTEGARSTTVKERTAHPADRLGVLTPEAGEFLAAALDEAYGMAPPAGLAPSAVTTYRRRTLVDRSGRARLTLDDQLEFTVGRERVAVPPGWVLAESKSAGPGTGADRALRALGVRPRRISKYCLAVMCLYPGTRGNAWRSTLAEMFAGAEPERAPVPGPAHRGGTAPAERTQPLRTAPPPPESRTGARTPGRLTRGLPAAEQPPPACCPPGRAAEA